MRNSMLRALLVASVLLGGVAATAAAQAGAVTGRVTDQANGQPVVGARVQVIGTSITGQTNAEGRYRFSNVPSGQQTVRVVALGYGAQNKVVEIRANEVAAADFSLAIVAFSLEEFVVTATGEQSRREIGNAVSTVNVEDLARTAPVSNMGDLLAARAPGVTVIPGQLTGGSSRIRIRGNSSISLSNNPIYVVDGIRVWSEGTSTIGVGGTLPSRINDINPEDIESIDIAKGPSASTLYGTDAANGVIVIKTKRGRAGKPVWNAYIEQGFITDRNEWPTAYRGWRSTSTISNTTQCLVTQTIAGACVQDSVSSYNLFEDPEATPNGTGHRQQYGLQVSGGTDAVRYFLASEWEGETGYLQMPRFARDYLKARRVVTEVPAEQERPNTFDRFNLRANLSTNLSETLDFTLSSAFTKNTLLLPQTDNNVTGLLSSALGGPGFRNNQVSHGTGLPVRTNYGYRLYTPDESFSETTSQDISRTIMGGTLNWRPTAWLAIRGIGGVDYTGREDAEICMRFDCAQNSITRTTGFKSNNRSSNYTYTGDVSGTASYDLAGDLRARTILGTQYSKQRLEANNAFAYDMPGGTTTVSAGAIPTAGESTFQSSTLGYFAEQWFGWRDKVFLTLGVRSDRNSAFGASYDRVYYPKAAVSWVVSDESFMPTLGPINSIRLRGAYGASGRQPGPNDAIPFLTAQTAAVEGKDTPALVVSALGNPDLKPERSTELELGLDLSLFESRLNFEFTYFDKDSRDALIERVLAPSLGSAATQFANLGLINNHGFEGVVSATVLNQQAVGWDLTLAGSWLTNKIESMGGLPPIVGSENIQAQGYPVDGYWFHPVEYRDANGDGLIAASELTVGADRVFAGYSQPRGEITLFTGFEMLGRKLRIQGNIDSKFGYKVLNDTERIRCESRVNCRGAVDPRAPLSEQARSVSVRETAVRSKWGYVETADFIRFRELSATWTMPDRWAGLVGASRATLTVAGRNLGVLTGYTGMDPETGYFDGDDTQQNFQSAPPPSYFTFRLNVTF